MNGGAPLSVQLEEIKRKDPVGNVKTSATKRLAAIVKLALKVKY